MNAPVLLAAPTRDDDERAGLSIDLRHLIALVYRNRWLIAAVFAACLLGAVLATVFATRLYAAAASVQIEQQAAKVLEGSTDREPAAAGGEADRFLQTNDYEDPDFPLVARPITIGARAWIAAEAFVAPGVTIGEGAVLGACAVATRGIPPWTVAIGNPAQVVKQRSMRPGAQSSDS